MSKESKYVVLGLGASLAATAAYCGYKLIHKGDAKLQGNLKKYKCQVDGLSDDEVSPSQINMILIMSCIIVQRHYYHER